MRFSLILQVWLSQMRMEQRFLLMSVGISLDMLRFQVVGQVGRLPNDSLVVTFNDQYGEWSVSLDIQFLWKGDVILDSERRSIPFMMVLSRILGLSLGLVVPCMSFGQTLEPSASDIVKFLTYQGGRPFHRSPTVFGCGQTMTIRKISQQQGLSCDLVTLPFQVSMPLSIPLRHMASDHHLP